MRVGQNPLKSSHADYTFAPIVLSVITHLPNLTSAYHSQRLEVVQTCLRSMRENARREHTFIVWDNGSVPLLRDWLRDEFQPDVLMLSPNIGKISARTMIARMLPPETIVTCSDDDMLFFNDWLNPQLDLLASFPSVACVSGYPCRTAFRWGIENTLTWARRYAELEFGRFLPQEWEDDFALSVGRTPEWHKNYTQNDIDYRVTFQGKQAYCTAHHCQFIARAKTLAAASWFDDKATGDEKPFDVTMDKIGLRLSTTQRLARHIGNVLDETIKQEALQLI